jgi:hypothetical protein
MKALNLDGALRACFRRFIVHRASPLSAETRLCSTQKNSANPRTTMKTQILSLIAVALVTSLCLAQVTPGGPQTNGLTPRTASIDVNPGQNNGATESTGVGIAANGNVIIGWEDDSTTEDDIFFRGAVWTLYSTNLSLLISNTTITNYTGSQSMVNYYRAFFRTNGTPTPGNTAWGPKIKANRFGNGIGLGATAFALGFEIPTLAAINLDAGGGGDFPAVQLLNNNGTPAGIVTGVADADAEPSGDIRIADWEYLANGNIVIVGESRQTTDRALTGQTAGNVAVYRIVTPAGAQVKGYTAVSAEPVGSDIWHGVGVTANGFAVRFNQANITRVRMFDNAGNPTTTNLGLTNLTGQASAAAGGRGDGTGFTATGTDAYVYTTTGGGTPWVTVLNADGTLRWSRRVVDASVTNPPASDRVDAAIAPDGRVIAVWDDESSLGCGRHQSLATRKALWPIRRSAGEYILDQ